MMIIIAAKHFLLVDKRCFLHSENTPGRTVDKWKGE
jgi:hypothetical protein